MQTMMFAVSRAMRRRNQSEWNTLKSCSEFEDVGPDAVLAVSGSEPRIVGRRVGDHGSRRLVDQGPGHDGRSDHQDEDQGEAD